MNQEQSLKDLCRIRREELHMSAQRLSELTDIPISTINKFFADASKAPSIYTAGPICRVLGIDLNHYFAIVLPDSPQDQTALAVARAKTEVYERVIAVKNRWLRVLAAALGVLVLGIIALLIYDLTMLDRGWFQTGSPRLGWLLPAAIVACALGVLALIGFLSAQRRKR